MGIETFARRDSCVLPEMLNLQAERQPDSTLVVFDEHTAWSYAKTRDEALQSAAALQALGVERGDRVLVFVPSGVEIFTVHLGCLYAGAIFVPINIALRGSMLAHVVENSGARFLICHSQLLSRVFDVAFAGLETIVCVGEGPFPVARIRILDSAVLRAPAQNFRPLSRPLEPWDIHGIYYTSGTSGVSKGVLCPHLHTMTMARTAAHFLTADDRFLINHPYFHLSGALFLFAVVACGASMTSPRQFRTATFWDEVRATGATACVMMGGIATFLLKQQSSERDRTHGLRSVLQVPLCTDLAAFSERFGVAVYTVFDMTELPGPLRSGPLRQDPPGQGYVGELNDYEPRMEVRLVDVNDIEVPVGDCGELVVRCEVPWVISPGYHNMYEATARAWRNGWFHTGDVLRRDEQGRYYFVDRIKDSIRRRGENISSFEVEREVRQFPGVYDAAAIAVPSQLGEDELMVIVAARHGHRIEPRALIQFLIERLPHYMVPRYVRFMGTLPYTDTHKVRKNELRDEGLSAQDVWDRESAGIIVRRDHIA